MDTCILGVLIIHNTDKTRHKRLIIDLKIYYLKGVNKHLPTLVKSFVLMLNYDVKKNVTDDYDDYHALKINMIQREATPILGADREFHLVTTCCK